ncbi:MAG: redoxin domain-containing protein [Candidimonas sp.]|nr:MAG: redoxin domain-containing protein [Candidimonas sp.]TAM21864.1 MAG: redoxin domain-containing protein [Candidimonas sp.]TAM77889.1 MAG: redoxin domain-containing protein [Candidimonas sp.]
MNPLLQAAPSWFVSQWLNTASPITLDSLRGKVTVLHAFQMLCPACVSHGIPQAKAIYQAFPQDKVAVIGLHTVFEHHAAMTPVALEAFVHEYRLGFPIGIDQADPRGLTPLTMSAYGMEGTPTLVLIDKAGYIRLHHFGKLDDIRVGAVIGQLLTEPVTAS